MDDSCELLEGDEPVRWTRTADRPGRMDLPCTDPVLRRIAAIGRDAAQVRRFERLLARGFVPSATIREALGTGSTRILVDGFVQPIGDSLTGQDDDGAVSITRALAQAAEILRQGAGIGIDFSPLRPAGANVGRGGARAAGPAAYLRLFEQLQATLRTGDAARGKFTAALSIDHPDVEAFMTASASGGSRRCALMSGDFVEALRMDTAFALQFEGAARSGDDAAGVHLERAQPPVLARARSLWHAILNGCGEEDLGLVFTDRAASRNGLAYCERMEAVPHPGGPLLPAYGALPQGTLMLPAFLVPFGPAQADFDHSAFGDAVEGAVEFLDRVLDVTACPLPEQHVELKCTRRIGLGCSGLGEVLAGMRQGPATIEGMCTSNAIWSGLRDHAVAASIELARLHGAFPLFDQDHFPCPGRLAVETPRDKALLAQIRRHGIRNGQLLSGCFADHEGPHAMRPRDRIWLSAMAAAGFDGGLTLPLRITRRPTIEQAAGVVLRAWQGGATSVLLQRRRATRQAPDPAYCFEQDLPEVLH